MSLCQIMSSDVIVEYLNLKKIFKRFNIRKVTHIFQKHFVTARVCRPFFLQIKRRENPCGNRQDKHRTRHIEYIIPKKNALEINEMCYYFKKLNEYKYTALKRLCVCL